MKKQKTISKAELARREGVSAPMVTKWIGMGMPVLSSGRIEPAKARAWLRANTEHRKSSASQGLTAARRRKELALARLREMEADQKAGALVATDDVRAAVSKMITAARNKLLGMGDELADKLAATSDPIACRMIVDERVHRALTELSEWTAKNRAR